MHENDIHGAQPEVRRYLDIFVNSLVSIRQISGARFGCGAGRATLDCLQRGYDAVGIDINAGAVAEGQAKLDAAGFNGETEPLCQRAERRAAVRNGSLSFCIFTAGYRTRRRSCKHEPRTPPRIGSRRLRVAYLSTAVQADRSTLFYAVCPLAAQEPVPALGNAGFIRPGHRAPTARAPRRWSTRARRNLVSLLIAHTFYRPFSSIVRTLRSTGHDVCLIASNHRKLVHSRALAPLYRWRSPRVALGWIMSTFAAAYVLTRAADPDFQEPMFEMGAWHSEWIMAYDSALHYTVRETNVPA